MHIFYDPLIRNSRTGELVALNKEESHHAIKVLRLSEGAAIHVVNGSGGFFSGHIVSPDPKALVLKLLAVTEAYQRRNHYLHIAVAPTKNIERIEWFLEKAVEIGIDEITPVICDRSERREVKSERLLKVMIAAMKQSQKAYLPKLNEAVKLAQFKVDGSSAKLIAHCAGGKRDFIRTLVKPNGAYTVLIGPEGDFSDAEISRALGQGFMPVTLGDSRLRTETAALAACFEVNYLNTEV